MTFTLNYSWAIFTTKLIETFKTDMEEKDSMANQNISLTIPIRIGYMVIETYLRKKFIGEIISREGAKGQKSKYAEIMDISLSKSNSMEFDLAIILKVRTLTFLYRNKELQITIDVSLAFDSETQKISIDQFKIDSQGRNWMADQLLESIINKFVYQKVKKQLNFDLMPTIEEQINSINTNLAQRLETSKGIFIVGSMEKLIISHLEARESDLWIFMALQGWGVVEIENLEF